MKIFKINLKSIKTFINSFILLNIFFLNIACEKNKITNFSISEYLIDFLKNNNQESNFIAHAGGGINSNIYTNSIEALELSIKNNFKLIEIDFMETSDGFFIGGHHDWPSFKKKLLPHQYKIDNKPMSLNEVKNSKIYNKYQPLTIDYINEIFNKNKTLFLVTDKTNNFKKIVTDFTFDQKRIIVEIFGRDNYFLSIKEGIINPMLSASISDYDFILKNNIKLIAIHSNDLIDNKEKYKELIKKNVFIFVYSTNNKKFIEDHLDVNVSGFYTDFWNFEDNICKNETCITY
jgi:glycerophosphoryl diester phosphodiesterase